MAGRKLSKKGSFPRSFLDLHHDDLKQPPIYFDNFFERLYNFEAFSRFFSEKDKSILRERGLIYIESGIEGKNCYDYAIGSRQVYLTLEGILEHNGKPEEGDIVIYGENLNNPKHAGIYKGENKVVSKWGEYGPVLKHDLEKILPHHGCMAVFSTYKSKSSIQTQ